MEQKTKAFDAVNASRQWREATSRKLDAMPLEQRLAYLKSVSEQFRVATRTPRATSAAVLSS